MASERNIYKYNLDILKNIEIGRTLYYEENKIIIEDRYFGYFRFSFNQQYIHLYFCLIFQKFFAKKTDNSRTNKITIRETKNNNINLYNKLF